MSHDTDKLIRQLSLVAFLMAERRPLTARDVKGERRGLLRDVRRGVRAPVLLGPRRAHRARRPAHVAARRVHGRGALHAPLGELLPRPARPRRRRAGRAADGALLPRGEVRVRRAAAARAPEPRARPSGVPRTPPTATAERVRVTAPDYSPELAGRLSKLESAISKQRTIQFGYWSPARERETERAAQPVRAPARRGRLVRRRPRPRPRRDAHVPCRADPRRHPLRDTARARLPPAARVRRRGAPRRAAVADRRNRRPGADRGPGRHRVVGRTARSPTPARVDDGVFETRYATLEPLAGWVLRQNGRAVPLEPDGAARRGAPMRSRLLREQRTRATAPDVGARATRADALGSRAPSDRPGRSRPSASAFSRRCSRTSSPPAATSRTADARRRRARRRGSRSRARSCRITLSLLNLVNFGGGCYTVYAEVDEDAGRRPGRQGAVRRRVPQGAEADAARGARDPARDRVRRPDDRRRGAHAARARAQEARGDVRAVRARRTPAGDASATTRKRSCARSRDAAEKRRSSRSST